MATTVQGEQLTTQFYNAQLAQRALLLYELLQLWPLLDPLRLDQTAGAWLQLAVRTVLSAFNASARNGVRYYHAFRRAEIGEALDAEFFDRHGVRGANEVGLLAIPNQRQIRTALTVTGPVALKQRIGRGVDLDQAQRLSFVDFSGAAGRLAINGGREAVQALSKRDDRAIGWARVTSPTPCGWCAMLSSRGPVYHTRETAGFQAHDHCACHPEPVFSRDAPWPGRGREFEELWKKTTGDVSGKEKVRAFRRAYEKQQRENS